MRKIQMQVFPACYNQPCSTIMEKSMQQLEQYFVQILENNIYKLIISKPKKKDEEYNKIVIEKKMTIIKLPNIRKSRSSMKM